MAKSGDGVIERADNGDIVLLRGSAAPSDGQPGYSPSCLFLKSDGTIYWNNASDNLSCNFDQITLP